MITNNEELEELAAQLKQPNGTKGIQVAEMMNETNIKMTVHSIDMLKLCNHDHILELGHGNCGHLDYLLKQQSNLVYYGLEMSALMNEEAKRINKSFIDNDKASFYLYDGLKIPFTENTFDKIFTVNTIYFWAKPELLLMDLYRVLKPGGILNITFAQKSFMQQLPFTPFGFNLYDDQKIKQLVNKTPFKITSSDTRTETIKSKTGDMVNRDFTTISLSK